MSKALIIAEKPSVANDIARALGGFTKHDEYYESEDYVLSSAVGHLLEIAAPEEFEVKRGKWSFANLPVIPPHFDLNPIAKTESRLKVLTKLLKRKDVDRLINACDAGREGELIFRLIAQHAGRLGTAGPPIDHAAARIGRRGRDVGEFQRPSVRDKDAGQSESYDKDSTTNVNQSKTSGADCSCRGRSLHTIISI